MLDVAVSAVRVVLIRRRKWYIQDNRCKLSLCHYKASVIENRYINLLHYSLFHRHGKLNIIQRFYE